MTARASHHGLVPKHRHLHRTSGGVEPGVPLLLVALHSGAKTGRL